MSLLEPCASSPPQAARRPPQRSKTCLPAHPCHENDSAEGTLECGGLTPPWSGDDGTCKTPYAMAASSRRTPSKRGMSKTKLKTSCFLAQMTRKKAKAGWFLTKRAHKRRVERRCARENALAPGERESRDSGKMKNRGNEAKKYLKTKDITFFVVQIERVLRANLRKFDAARSKNSTFCAKEVSLPG